ncbi:hypothetical protein DPEC_G00362000 [Dallia pectoralis]|nr:hypothetical protein DPEC_G00362000 [Dallia pectoralis]
MPGLRPRQRHTVQLQTYNGSGWSLKTSTDRLLACCLRSGAFLSVPGGGKSVLLGLVSLPVPGAPLVSRGSCHFALTCHKTLHQLATEYCSKKNPGARSYGPASVHGRWTLATTTRPLPRPD